MTATVLEFKCPTYGHLLGEEEYKHSNANIDRLFEEKSQGLIEELNYEHDKKIKEIQDKHARDIENEVNQILASITKEIQYENDKEKQEMEAWYKDQLKLKDFQIQQAKLQNDIDIEQKIKQATEYNDKILLAQYKQKETENELQHRRIKEENRSLLNQVEKLQKALDSVPPELRGTAGEIVLFDHLHDAFPKDEFILKKVGVKMADVIQTIVLGNGEKLAPPIAWDKKTDKDKISKDDIDKAKSYKIIHNTDFSVIVTSKGITEKDSNNTLIGTREGILLVHPSIVVEICKLLRSFIIEMAKHRRSKQVVY